MDIDQFDACAIEPFSFDECHHLIVTGVSRHGQAGKCVEYSVAWFEIPKRNLTENERMHQHQTVIQQIAQSRITFAEVIGTDGCINQDQAVGGRRRGGALNFD